MKRQKRKTVYCLKTRLDDSEEWSQADEYSTRKERDEHAAALRIVGGFRTHSFEKVVESEPCPQ